MVRMDWGGLQYTSSPGPCGCVCTCSCGCNCTLGLDNTSANTMTFDGNDTSNSTSSVTSASTDPHHRGDHARARRYTDNWRTDGHRFGSCGANDPARRRVLQDRGRKTR